jgi:hypothetical protein
MYEGKPNFMASKSKSGVNVSAAIREFLESNTTVGPTEAAKSISAKLGKKVSPIYVSNVKTLMNSKGKKNTRKRRNVARRASAPAARMVRRAATGSVDLSTIAAVKSLLNQVSAGTAKELIDLLA